MSEEVKTMVHKDPVQPEELDYSKSNQELRPGSYRYQKLPPFTTGGSSPTMSLTNTTETSFEIPAKVVNFDKSMVSCTVKLSNLNTKYNHAHQFGLCEIDRVSLATRSGVQLCNIAHTGIVHKALAQAYTPQSEFMSLPRHKTGATEAVCYEAGCKFSRSNADGDTALSAHGDSGEYINNAGAYAHSEDNVVGVRHAVSGAVGDAGTAGDLFYRLDIPLSQFHGSILAKKQDLFFAGEILVLTIHWSLGTKWGFTSDAIDAATNPVALATAPEVTKLNLYLAVETDRVIESAVKNAFMSGKRFTIPWITVVRDAMNASEKDFSQKISRAHGKRLLRMGVIVANNSEVANLWGNFDNTAGSKTTSFYTQLDGFRLQDGNLTTATGDDYRQLKPLLRGSAYASNDMYRRVPIWFDNWAGNRSVEWADEDEIESGLDLTKSEYLWAWSATSAVNAQVIYAIMITQRDLYLGPGGIMVA